MPVTTRTTTRVTRSQSMYSKPASKAAPQTTRSILCPQASSSQMHPTKTSKKTSRIASQKASKATTKRSRKPTTNNEVTIAARRAAMDARAEAMRREWAAVVATRPPRKTLSEEDFPGHELCGPRFVYGWAYDEDYMIEYARRHRLTFPVIPTLQARFGGKDEYNYGDLTEEDLAHEPLRLSLRRTSASSVLEYLADKTGVEMTVERPLSLKYKRMVVLWSNYDVEQKYAAFDILGIWNQVSKFLDDAMNECLPAEAERTELLWYWSADNKVLGCSP